MSITVIGTPQVLLFAYAADGERWVTTCDSRDAVPKRIENGKTFTVVCCAPPRSETLAMAVAWARGAQG